MSLTDEDTVELHELLDGLVENNLSPSRKAKLETWIEESEEVRKIYVYYMDMSASLVHYADERLSDETEEPQLLSSFDKITKFVRPVLLVAALLIAGFYLPRTWFGSEKAENELAATTESSSQDGQADVIVDTVAVLTKTVGVEWADDSTIRPASGNTLEPCTLKLKSGLAQVEFLQGSIVVLEGPVEFDIINPNEGALAIGKLRASVPQVSSGFSIGVPNGKVIDLGTEFGLHVHDGGSTEVLSIKERFCMRDKREPTRTYLGKSQGENLFSLILTAPQMG